MADERATTKRPAEEEPTNQRPTKRHHHDYNDTITVLVGEEEKRFTVHKDVICVKSKFFRAACSKRWREGQEKVVRLPEVRPVDLFQLYMDWTYTNELDLSKAAHFDYTKLTKSDIVSRLIELYLLGNVLDDVKLRNNTLRLMTAAIKEFGTFLHPVQCHHIWQRTVPNSSIRKWVVDHLVSLSSSAWIEEHGLELPGDLVLQAAVMLMARHAWGMYDPMETLDERLESYMEVEDDA